MRREICRNKNGLHGGSKVETLPHVKVGKHNNYVDIRGRPEYCHYFHSVRWEGRGPGPSFAF